MEKINLNKIIQYLKQQAVLFFYGANLSKYLSIVRLFMSLLYKYIARIIDFYDAHFKKQDICQAV